MRQALDAQLLVLDGDGLRVLAVDGDVLGEIGLGARQRLGELQAQARGGGLRFGFVVDHAEAVLGAQMLVGCARAGIVLQREAGLQGIDGGAPERAPLQRARQHDERARLDGWVGGALITEVGGARSIDREIVALAALVGIGVDREQCTRKADPGQRIVVIGDDGTGEAARSGARIGTKRALALGAQIHCVAPGQDPVALEVGFVALGVLRDLVMREGLWPPIGPGVGRWRGGWRLLRGLSGRGLSGARLSGVCGSGYQEEDDGR